jgi:hypothetical protein
MKRHLKRAFVRVLLATAVGIWSLGAAGTVRACVGDVGRESGGATMGIPTPAALGLARPAPLLLSVLSGDALDTLAEVLSWAVLVIVPVVGIAVFWILHIMPEKIAEKRHHPQAKAIQTLCLLSLFFGGLFWPLAWLWAYSKPVLYKMAYGKDVEKHGHDAAEGAVVAEGTPAVIDDLRHVRERLDALAHKAPENEELRATIRQVAVLEARVAAEQSATGGQA